MAIEIDQKRWDRLQELTGNACELRNLLEELRDDLQAGEVLGFTGEDEDSAEGEAFADWLATIEEAVDDAQQAEDAAGSIERSPEGGA